MIKIGFEREIYNVKMHPTEVVEVVSKITNTLQENYWSYRNVDEDMGGYILIIEDTRDFQLLINEVYLDIENDTISEFVDQIKCKNGQIFTSF